MADWSRPFSASYRFVRVSRATGYETGVVAGVEDGGTIERNLDTSVKESGALTAVGWEPLGADLLRAYLVATFPDGAVAEEALGTFLASVSSRSLGGPSPTCRVSLMGRLQELADDMLETAVTVPAGANAVQRAAQLARDAGLEVVADASDYALPGAVVYGVSAASGADADETRLDAINDLLSRAGFSSASTDPYGRVVMRRYVEPADRAPSASFAEGPTARFLREVTDERDASGVANVVLAVCPDEGGGGLVGRAEDASGGEWSVASVGRRIVHKETVDGVATQTAADARAAELLRTSQAVVRRLTVRHVYAPVAVGDSVDVSYGDASGRFAVRVQRLTLAHGCLTESELRAYER